MNALKLFSPSLKKFLSYTRPYLWMLIMATICGLLKYNIPIAFPWVLKDVINQLITPATADPRRIHLAMAALIVLFTLWSVITFFRSYFADHLSNRLIFDLRHEFYTHLQRLSLSFYEKRQVGAIASRLFGDIAIAQNFVGAAFTNSLMDVSSIFLITILLFHMNWRLALVSLTIFPLYVVLNKHFKTKIKRTSKLAQDKMEEIAGKVNEKLGGISIIQSFTREKMEEKHFLRDHRVYLQYRLANVKNNAGAAALIGFLTSVAPVLVVWYGAMQVLRGHLTVGELTAFYAYLGMFYQPLNRLTELNIQLANSKAAIDRIYEIFSLESEIIDSRNAREIKSIRGVIEFENVSFAYESSGHVLTGIDLKIPEGLTIALVGPSGAGKSTLVKLIPRFYDATEGKITIDGINIVDIPLRALRQNIAIVPQDPILFSGTIAENIHFGRRDATESDIFHAAELANADEFIRTLPYGYKTQIGEGGIKLSGGQKQRVALARAFLKNAPILILDEATSALDSESENLIQQALQKLIRGRTTLIIAHRLSTTRNADLIVVFDNGRIVEKGNHAELIQTQGLYRKLYDEQISRFFTLTASDPINIF